MSYKSVRYRLTKAIIRITAENGLTMGAGDLIVEGGARDFAPFENLNHSQSPRPYRC